MLETEIKKLTAAIEKLTETLTDPLSPADEPVKEEAPADEPVKEEAPASDLTHEDVQAKCLEICRADRKKKGAVTDVLGEYDATRVKEIAIGKLSEVMAKLGAL